MAFSMAQAKPAMGVSRNSGKASASRAAEAALKTAAARPAFLGKSVSVRAAALGRRSNGAALKVQAAAMTKEELAAAAAPKDPPLKSLFPQPPPPLPKDAPRLKVAIVGSGLSALSTAVELLDQGHEVELYEQRPFVGGKVASYVDKDGNHIEMGLHVFFGCYQNLFRLMNKCGVLSNLLVKDHTHIFINKDGDRRDLDFRMMIGDTKIGAPIHGLNAFFTTPQLTALDKAANSLALGTSPIVKALVAPELAMQDIRDLDNISFTDWFCGSGGNRHAIERMWDPIAYALGFIDCDNISARCMLTIFQFFATKTDASVLRMLNGSPADRLLKPITDYIEGKGGKIHLRTGCREVMYEEGADGTPVVTGLRVSKAGKEQIIKADAYVAALDVPGAKGLVPKAWRKYPSFDNIYKLVITVQMRFDGWVTELVDMPKSKVVGNGARAGLDNLLYSPDADYSCFADLALVSPEDYYKEGEGSLLQVVITPCEKYLMQPNDKIVEEILKQTKVLFPTARSLNMTWSSVVKINQSLYREEPGADIFRPDQVTPVPNFFLAGSYTKQDYIDSMEGATLSGRQCAYKMMEIPRLNNLAKVSAGLKANATA